MIACVLQRAPAPRPATPGHQQERLVADLQHHARIAARHPAETRVEFAGAAPVGREGHAGHSLYLVLRSNPLGPR